MKHFLLILTFTVVVSGFYTAISQLLPQLPNHPPTKVELGSNIGPEDLAAAGAGVFEASCAQCHLIGGVSRGPDLADIGRRAHERAKERSAATGKGYTDADYLVEALCKPGDYLADGFGNIMPPQGRSLSGGQVLATVAFLQSIGGNPTVKGTDVDTVERFGCVAPGGGGAAAAAAAEPEPVGSPEEVLATFGCSGCHSMDSDVVLVGPALHNAGSRMKAGELYEALLAPDATVNAPFPPGVMKATLDSNGFYERMTPSDYQALVQYLANKRG
jgi:cytochrome c2